MKRNGTEYHLFGASRLVGVAKAEMTYSIIGEAVIGKFCDRRAPNLVRTKWVVVICSKLDPKHDFIMQSLPVDVLAHLILGVPICVFVTNTLAHALGNMAAQERRGEGKEGSRSGARGAKGGRGEASGMRGTEHIVKRCTTTKINNSYNRIQRVSDNGPVVNWF